MDSSGWLAANPVGNTLSNDFPPPRLGGSAPADRAGS